MRDKTHGGFIERWVLFMKSNPNKWRAIHTKFINAQFQNSKEFYKRLKKTPNEKEKIRKIKIKK